MNVSDVTEIHFILKQMLMSVCQAHLPAMHKRTVSMISDPTTAPVKLAMLVTEKTLLHRCVRFLRFEFCSLLLVGMQQFENNVSYLQS